MEQSEVQIVEDTLKNLASVYIAADDYPTYIDMDGESIVVDSKEELFGMMKMLGIMLDVDAIDFVREGITVTVELV